MSKIKIELNSSGVRELLKEVGRTECVKIANKALSQCGDGYEMNTIEYPERTAAIVKATTAKAMRDNEKNNTLIKAVYR